MRPPTPTLWLPLGRRIMGGQQVDEAKSPDGSPGAASPGEHPLGVIIESGVAVVDATVRFVMSLPDLVPALQKVAEMGPVLDRIASLEARLEALGDLAPTLSSLDSSISNLESSIEVLSETLGPLQSTTQLLARAVDRLPMRRPK